MSGLKRRRLLCIWAVARGCLLAFVSTFVEWFGLPLVLCIYFCLVVAFTFAFASSKARWPVGAVVEHIGQPLRMLIVLLDVDIEGGC